jgi:hypothetical protein
MATHQKSKSRIKMPIVSAWQCPQTGKLFAMKDTYLTHLRKLAKSRITERKQRKFLAERVAFFAGMRQTCDSIEAVQQFVIDNWQAFVMNGESRGGELRSKRSNAPKMIKLSLTIGPFRKCSNSHSAPFTGVTNFCRVAGRPTEYWGWQGKFEWVIDADLSCFPSDVFEQTGICTGGGGGGVNRLKQSTYSGDFTMFADDWPTMAAESIRANVLQRLLTPDQSVQDYL